MSRYLTTRQVAERLGLRPNTVSQNAKAGAYPFAVDVGARDPKSKRKHKSVWRFDPDLFEAWLASRGTGDSWRKPKGARS